LESQTERECTPGPVNPQCFGPTGGCERIIGSKYWAELVGSTLAARRFLRQNNYVFDSGELNLVEDTSDVSVPGSLVCDQIDLLFGALSHSGLYQDWQFIEGDFRIAKKDEPFSSNHNCDGVFAQSARLQRGVFGLGPVSHEPWLVNGSWSEHQQ
jgi:hypothetical protein